MATPPDFTAGAILTAAQMNQVGSWLVKTQVVGSAVSSVTVTGAFNADFDNYKIIYDGGTASSNVSLTFQLSGATSGYHYAILVNQYNSSTPAGVVTTTGASFVEAGRSSTTRNSMNIEVFNPFLTAQTGYRTASVDYLTPNGFVLSGGGFLNNTTSYTSFVIAPASGTISGGTIRVYGYRN